MKTITFVILLASFLLLVATSTTLLAFFYWGFFEEQLQNDKSTSMTPVLLRNAEFFKPTTHVPSGMIFISKFSNTFIRFFGSQYANV